MANAASGMAVHDDCKLKFLKLKGKRTYRFIVFKIEEKQKQVIVEKLGEPTLTYEDFTASLLADECRYAVYDFDFVTRELPKEQDFFHCLVPRHSKGEKQNDLCKLQRQVQEGIRWHSGRAASN